MLATAAINKILLLKATHTTDAKLTLIRPIAYLLLLVDWLHQSLPLGVIAVVVVLGSLTTDKNL